MVFDRKDNSHAAVITNSTQPPATQGRRPANVSGSGLGGNVGQRLFQLRETGLGAGGHIAPAADAAAAPADAAAAPAATEEKKAE